ncbi:MAG: T9SS type A sorting domain-containing protein [Cryomorphaceae bacterium]|nr:T9SS type A sorting domain-containing protein [Cryomorphaceae bacterium]
MKTATQLHSHAATQQNRKAQRPKQKSPTVFFARQSLFFIAFLFLSWQSAFAYPFWVVSAHSDGDPCSNPHIYVTSSYATSDPAPSNAYLHVELQYQLSGGMWVYYDDYNPPMGLVEGVIWTFNLDPFLPPFPYGSGSNISFRAVVSLYENGNHWENVSNITTVFYPPTDYMGQPEITHAEFTGSHYQVSDCIPYTNIIRTNTTDLDLGAVSVRFHESNRYGDPLGEFYNEQVHWTKPLGGIGIPMPTFLDFEWEVNNNFANIITTYSGYLLIEIDYADYCETNSHKEFMLVRINNLPAISEFELIYENFGGPATPGYPYTSTHIFSPSHDVINPVELGSSTGGMYITTTTPYFAEWEVVISRWNGLGFTPIGGHTEISPNFSLDYIRFGHPMFYAQPNFSPADNPNNHIDELHKVELVLRSPNCPEATEYSYFVFPASLEFYRVDQDQGSEINHWHTRDEVTGGLWINIDQNAEIENLSVSLYSTSGQEVLQRNNWQKGTQLLDIPNLSKGVYILYVTDASGKQIYRTKVFF